MYMKKYWLIGIAFFGIGVTSCSFLECDPQDFGDETAYFKKADDLKMSVNSFY